MTGIVGFVVTLAICISAGLVLRKYKIKKDVEFEMLGGVCSGIAKILKIQPVWLRLGFVLSTIFFGFGIGLYIVLWIVMDEE
jgi:phage shock protein PspC (stress-responsive transcriptional regulator)